MGSVGRRLLSLAGSVDTPPDEMSAGRENECNEVSYEFSRRKEEVSCTISPTGLECEFYVALWFDSETLIRKRASGQIFHEAAESIPRVIVDGGVCMERKSGLRYPILTHRFLTSSAIFWTS